VIIREEHTVSEITQPIRFVDYAINLFPQIPTRNAVKKAIQRKELFLNSKVASTGNWLNTGDTIQLVESFANKPKRYDHPIEILFEDNYLAVVYKPPGMLVNGNQFRTLENCLIDVLKPSIEVDAFAWGKPVHRLDYQTSGLVVFAKCLSAHHQLSKLFAEQSVKKVYLAVLHGNLSEAKDCEFEIDGKVAFSSIEPIRVVPSLRNQWFTLVRMYPKTGRKHQLRIHASRIGLPIVGDKVHGDQNGTIGHKGLFLSAVKIEFKHPVLGTDVKIETKVPDKFESLMSREERRWRRVKTT
jgi:RluA family pseudouridine synthase